MKNTLSIGIVYLFSTSLLASTDRNRFEGAFNIGLEGLIESGVVESLQTDPLRVAREARMQLSYLVGALNGWGGGFDLDRTQIVVGTKDPASNRWSYSARVFISWPKNFQIPQVVGLPVPLRSDGKGLNEFFSRYSRFCSEDPNSSELDVGSFFYYFRPQNKRCTASSPGNKPLGVAFPNIKIGVSGLNTTGKSPEYGKVWEDGELTATILTGTNEPGATSNSDIGIAQYNTMYRHLWSTYGKPVSMNVPLAENAAPGMQFPDIEMTYDLGGGKKFNINILLIDKYQLQGPKPEFKARLQDRIENSDFISYNGHSGLGSNIRALVSLGRYKAGKYQLFYFNGCDTFSYVDNSLAEMHEKVNPGFGKYKFVDFISNSMPSPFNGFLQSNAAILNALMGMQGTYRQILDRFGSYQRAVVMGEEDNLWPKPFN